VGRASRRRYRLRLSRLAGLRGDQCPIAAMVVRDDGEVDMVRRCLSLCALLLLLAAAPAVADHGSGAGGGSSGKGGGDDSRDARVTGRCSKGATAQLRLRSRDGSIRADFEVKRRARESWRVVFVHERRVAWRGTVRTGGSGSFSIRRTFDDLDGADAVTARATGPGGVTCEAYAKLLG
jgi:hypothetical protein